MPLAYSRSVRNNHTIGFLDGTAHVGLQFRAVHLALAVNGIDFSNVDEKHA